MIVITTTVRILPLPLIVIPYYLRFVQEKVKPIAKSISTALQHDNSIDKKIESDFQTLVSTVHQKAKSYYRDARYSKRDLPMHELAFMLPEGLLISNEAFNDGNN